MRKALLLISAVVASAQQADPITDRMRYEIAAMQRDYLLAKQQLDSIAARMREKVTAAESACAAISKEFRMESLECAEKPKKEVAK